MLAPGGTLTLSRDNDWVYDSTAFDYGLTLTPLNGSHGVFLYLHKGALTARIEADGSVSLSMTTTDGLVKISTAAGVFAGPDDTHRINIQFDGEAGFVRIVVDGEIAAEGEASGQTLPLEYWGLTIGRPWNATLTAEVTDIVLSNESPLAAAPEVDPAELVYSLDFADMAGSGPIRIKTDAIVETEFGPALDITDGGSMIPRAVDFLYDQTSFDIALTLSAQDDPAGTLLYMHKTLSVELREDGRLEFTLTTDDGRQKIASSITDLNDGGLHEVRIGYDSAAGTMQIMLDGDIIAQGPQTGATPPVKFWGLNLGHPWSDDTANVLIHQVEGFDAPTVTGPFTAPQSNDIIFLDFEGGTAVNAIDSDAETKLEGEVQFVTENGDTALAFDRAGSIIVDRDAQSLFDVDSFTIGADIALAELGNQEILRIHKSLSLTAHDGKTKFSFTNSDGETFVVEDAQNSLTVGQEHNLQVLYSADAGVLQLMIDDVVVDQADAWGSTKDQEYWGLTIGGTFGNSFAGTLDDILFTQGANLTSNEPASSETADLIAALFVPDDSFL